MSRARDEVIEVWQDLGGYWQWEYRVLPDGAPIRTNRSHLSPTEAEESARLAYPGVPLVYRPAPPARFGVRLLLAALLVIVALLLALLAVVVASLAALVAMALARRRIRHLLRRRR